MDFVGSSRTAEDRTRWNGIIASHMWCPNFWIEQNRTEWNGKLLKQKGQKFKQDKCDSSRSSVSGSGSKTRSSCTNTSRSSGGRSSGSNSSSSNRSSGGGGGGCCIIVLCPR